MSSRNRSVDASRYAMVARPDVPRSAISQAPCIKTTFNGGGLIPIWVKEVLPGQTLHCTLNAFARLSTPIVPIMDNLYLESWFFFCPYRILWAQFERFMGEQANPTDTTQFLIPQIPFTDAWWTDGCLQDQMGLTKPAATKTVSVSALPFRAYNRIWNDWFRDEDLDAPQVVNTGDGPDSQFQYFIKNVRRQHDYFTSARPWPEKPTNETGFSGQDPMVPGGNMLIGPRVAVPVSGIGVGTSTGAHTGSQTIRQAGGRDSTYGAWWTQADTIYIGAKAPGNAYPDIRVMINDIRTANMLQLMMEKDARGGTRYAEKIRAHFGVISPDSRLQRPEYLGGGRTMVTTNPVAQTSASGVAGTTTVLGELAGIASAHLHGHSMSGSFTEHGVVLCLVAMRSDLTYQQGVDRFWFRRSLYEFYWPDLAHLGEQAIMSREIFCDGNTADTDVFGYIPRWDEYRWERSRTAGYFRSTATTPLDMWHLGLKFAARPVLNNAFVEEDAPISRVLQVATNYNQQVLMDACIQVRSVLPLPMFSIPGLGGRL